MRATRRRRPRRREVTPTPTGVDLDEIASRARYTGSSEHKRHPSFAGPARRRSDATACDPGLEQTALTELLRDAIRQGRVGAPWEGNYPRYAWSWIANDLYEGRLVNRGLGEYKGYRLLRAEWPRGLS